MDKYLSYCGLYCGACPFMVATEEGTTAELAVRFGKPEAEVICHGCKTTEHADCEFHACENSNGIDTCAECSESPCAKVIALYTDEWEHHTEVLANLNRIKQVGKASWLQEQQERWKCPQCGARTEWYQKECTKCQGKL